MHGAENVMRYKSVLNRINVFPVADGDTGTNLHATMRSILNESKPANSVKRTLESIADASLGGARGNSGIIFSQFLNGVSMEIAGGTTVSMEDFVLANKKSVEYAYKAVSNPVEGTMLTVIKDWADSLFDFHKNANSFQELLSHGYEVIEKSLKRTMVQLNVLRKAGVVDSGAKGFVLFIKGFMEAIIHGKKSSYTETEVIDDTKAPDLHLQTVFRYCVEAKIRGCDDIEKLRKALTGHGDSLIVAGNERVARIHIHTNDPVDVFDIVGSHEEILHQKVDDMKLQSDIIENRKYDIALVTDSIADLPQEMIDEHQVHVIPINIHLKGIEYLDKLTITNDRIIQAIDEEPEFPTSSQPDIKTVENTFENLLQYYDSVIAITVASKLSGTYNTFIKAAENVSKEGKTIEVIDSKTNSGTQGLLVLECINRIKAGESVHQIVDAIENIIPKSKIIVSVSTLTNMIKGGRLGTRAGKIAEKLNLKPIVTLDEEGAGTLGGAAFSHKGSRKKIIRTLVKLYKNNNLRSYAIVYIDDRNYAQDLAASLESITGHKPEFISKTSSVIAISAGKGAVALSYVMK